MFQYAPDYPMSLIAGSANSVSFNVSAPHCPTCVFAWELGPNCDAHGGKRTHTGTTWTLTAGLTSDDVIDSTRVPSNGVFCYVVVTAFDENNATSGSERMYLVRCATSGGQRTFALVLHICSVRRDNHCDPCGVCHHVPTYFAYLANLAPLLRK